MHFVPTRDRSKQNKSEVSSPKHKFCYVPNNIRLRESQTLFSLTHSKTYGAKFFSKCFIQTQKTDFEGLFRGDKQLHVIFYISLTHYACISIESSTALTEKYKKVLVVAMEVSLTLSITVYTCLLKVQLDKLNHPSLAPVISSENHL